MNKRMTAAEVVAELSDGMTLGIGCRRSDILRDRLEAKVEIDRATARRLFTLLCVLHIRA